MSENMKRVEEELNNFKEMFKWKQSMENEMELVKNFVTLLLEEDEEEIKKDKIKNYDLRYGVLNVTCNDCMKYYENDRNRRFLAELMWIPKKNVIALTEFGKKWAAKKLLDYDYDASLLMNYVYCKEYDFFKDKECKVNQTHGYEYVIVINKDKENAETYRGDTMNSWSTTVNRYVELFGKNCIPGYITEFMNVVYTIGNFMPVPEGCNGPRGLGSTRDYWDLALKCIYQCYFCELDCQKNKNSRSDECIIGHLLSGGKKEMRDYNIDRYTKWLERFGSGRGQDGWNAFVEENFMQPFVKKTGDNMYGEPYELWDGHFAAPEKLPEEEWQFEQFFVNARIRILERSKRIADALIESVK